MSNNYKNVFFGAPKKKELDKSEEIMDNEKTVVTQDAQTDPKSILTGNHQAFSLLKDGRNWHLVIVDIDLSTMTSKVKLEGKYDSEPRAILELNKLLAEQSKRMK